MATNKTPSARRPKTKAEGEELSLDTSESDTGAPETVAAEAARATSAAPAKKAGKSAAKKPARRASRMPARPSRATTYKVSLDLDAAGKEAIEAYATYGTIAAEGIEGLSQEILGFAHSSVEAQLALAKALMNATTFQEAIEAQNEFTRASFSNLATEWAKLSGLSVELSQKLMEPVQARVNEAARTIWEPLAA